MQIRHLITTAIRCLMCLLILVGLMNSYVCRIHQLPYFNMPETTYISESEITIKS
jgi:hypothetical protein